MRNEKLAILIPLFNDWISCGQLIRNLDHELADYRGAIEVFILDDGSTAPASGLDLPAAFQKLHSIQILRMRRNLGHQRSICVWLCFVEAQRDHDQALIMDSDGEDRPSDARRLLEESAQAPDKVVFARRARRTEGLVFRFGYGCYRLLHRLLTGQDIHFGNFSVVPRSQLRAITAASELWNHFAGCVLVTRVPYTAINTVRGTRYAGKSTMNVQSLVIHGLSAIAVFSPTAATRAISAFAFLGGLATIAVIAVIVIRFTTSLAIPGWTSVVVSVFFLVVIQSVLSVLTFLFLILGARSQATFLPARDYSYFIDTVLTIGGTDGNS